jgi:ABC transporter substrate binding protein
MRPSATGLAFALALALLAAPLAAGAQPPARTPARVGYLGNSYPSTVAPTVEAFRQGLRDLGWIEGQSLVIEYRWAEGDPDRLPALAAELIRLKVDVIALSGTLALRATQQATSSIPIVTGVLLIDPVDAGFVASLARPGGNITGLASQYEEIVTKQVQLRWRSITIRRPTSEAEVGIPGGPAQRGSPGSCRRKGLAVCSGSQIGTSCHQPPPTSAGRYSVAQPHQSGISRVSGGHQPSRWRSPPSKPIGATSRPQVQQASVGRRRPWASSRRGGVMASVHPKNVAP